MEKISAIKKQKWIVAVSGGSDSMALLAMCVNHDVNVIVAHVNYQKRSSAGRDMQEVQKYCKKHHLPCYVKNVEGYHEGNFQAQARDIRYSFFSALAAQEGCEGVLVAHHLDDVIETYLMQCERGNTPTFYGLQEESIIYQVRVKRPLLNSTKQELINYCQQHNVIYHDDESNFDEEYTRNRIRHQVIDRMDRKDKDALKKEIDLLNKERNELLLEVKKYEKEFETTIDCKVFKSISNHLQKEVLRSFIMRNTKVTNRSDKSLNQLLTLIYDKTKNFKHNINEHHYLSCEYGTLFVVPKIEESFAYVYHKVELCTTPYFTIAKQGSVIESLTIYESDLPITIRNAEPKDKIKLRMGTKKVARFFIDKKISHRERKIWPVVVNCKGNVIFVCGIGCDIEHYSNNSTMFVLK